jgi:hypothetical protein
MADLEKILNKLTLLILLLLAISSCAERRGGESATMIYKEKSDLVAGKIFKTEVVARYKNPTYEWKDKVGNEVYNYQYVTEVPFWYSYIPVISVFFRPISKINRYDNSLVFDKNGTLVQTSFFAEEFNR